MIESGASDYRDALSEFHRALDEWNWAGEPQSGKLFERLRRVRERLLAAIHAKQDGDTDGGGDAPGAANSARGESDPDHSNTKRAG